MSHKLYIAYGSNLCKWKMRQRCPSARPLGKFLLTKARLVFRGAADVEFDPNSDVPCGLWRISAHDERMLDQYEGVGGGHYFKSEDIVLKYEGQPTPALIYLMTSQGIYPPSSHYASIIRQGYRDFGLDEAYLDAAIRRSYDDKNPTQRELDRRGRQRKSGYQRKLAELPLEVALQRLDATREQLEKPAPASRPSKKTRKAAKRAAKKATRGPESSAGPRTVVDTGPRLTERNAVVYGD